MLNITTRLLSVVILLFSSLWLSAPTHAGKFLSSSTCSGAGVVGCRAFDSMNNVTELTNSAVPNTPENPLTSNKCRWNGGSYDCYPVFDGGNCAVMDSLGQRSQESLETAKLWSPCYDANVDAARMTYWNDLDSSIHYLNAINADTNVDFTQIWVQYEIMLSPEFFFNPEGTYNAKLYRIERVKSDTCNDKRFADDRFYLISPDQVKFGPVAYCANMGYAGGETNFAIDKTRAGHWIRLTTHYDITNGTITYWGYDVNTGELLSHKYTDSHKGTKINFTDSKMNIKGMAFLLHASSHHPNLEKPSPHFWVRNAVLSGDPISPYPGNTPTPPPRPSPPTSLKVQ